VGDVTLCFEPARFRMLAVIAVLAGDSAQFALATETAAERSTVLVVSYGVYHQPRPV
jgi:hypothetical protein